MNVVCAVSVAIRLVNEGARSLCVYLSEVRNLQTLK